MTTTIDRRIEDLSSPVRTHGRPDVRARPQMPVWVIWALLVCILTGWVGLYALVLSGVQMSRDQAERYADLREGLAAATTPVGGQITPGAPVFLIDAPSGGIRNLVVAEGTTSGDLMGGPGHRSDTVFPGQAGVSVVYGRSVTFGGPFRKVSSLVATDPIVVTTGQGTFTYLVDAVRRPGDPLPRPLVPGQSRLTLVTSSGQAPFGLGSPMDTVYIDASLKAGQTVQPIPTGRAGSVPAAALPMGTDASGLFALVLWLQGLLIAVGIAIWGAIRWGRWKSWITVAPVLLFLLYATTHTAMLLMPNIV